MKRIGIFYHSDPVGGVPSGIDSVIRGILQYAPEDLHYTLFGATSDPLARPPGAMTPIEIGGRRLQYLPLIRIDPDAARGRVPFTVKYMFALQRAKRSATIRALDILDFHRIDPVLLFRGDVRPKNVMLHQDMSVIRDPNSDILWRHAPWLYEALEQRLFGVVDRIFTVRQSAVTRYAQRYPELAQRFEFIPTWVDTGTFHPAPHSTARQRFGVPADAPLALFVGRLDRQKDPLLLLQALRIASSEQPDLHLLIIGDGALRPELEALIAQEGLAARVRFAGALDRAAIADALRAADLFVLSSAYEGMPIAVLEALATGVPVVSTDVGELRRVIADGSNGYLSPSREPRDLAATLVLALSRRAAMRGAPCEMSVRPYHAATVLARIYENHRNQQRRGVA